MQRAPEHSSVVRSRSSSPGLEVQLFLDAYGDALTRGDVEAVASMWAVPALVLHHTQSIAVMSTDEIESFFAAAVAQYPARGIVATRPEIQEIQWQTKGMTVIVYVRWPWLDAHGEELGAEYSTYTLQRDLAGELKLRVALLRYDTH
jgi:ketosteroid isomerase-like protein